MAARLNLKQQADVRAKIQASQLVNVLQQHIFEGRDLKKSQVSAAIALLRKTVPDLSQVQGVMTNVNVNASDVSDAELAAIIAGDHTAVSSVGTSEEAEEQDGAHPVH